MQFQTNSVIVLKKKKKTQKKHVHLKKDGIITGLVRPCKSKQRLRSVEARDKITRGASCGLNLTYCSLRYLTCSNFK